MKRCIKNHTKTIEDCCNMIKGQNKILAKLLDDKNHIFVSTYESLVDRILELYREENELKNTEKQCLLSKIDKYEKLKEQEVLLKLPCKIGDAVYIISRGEVIPLEIDNICINNNAIYMNGKNEQHFGYGNMTLNANKKPIEWFLSKEEAEQSLL